MTQQLDRAYENFRAKATELERYIYLASLQDRNETLFFRLSRAHRRDDADRLHAGRRRGVPAFSHIYRRARGLYIALEQRDRIETILRNPDARRP